MSELIAFIGVGNMGNPMAQNLVKAGKKVKVFDVSKMMIDKAKEKKLDVVEKLEDVSSQIDIVNVFRPSKETPDIAKNAIKIGAKTLWLQFGIQNKEAEKISKSAGLNCIMNKCIKQEYQRLFLRMKPVFPVLLND